MAADLEALRAQLLVSKRVEVVGGGGFDVFGLSLPSIVAVCRNHFEDCRQLFMQLASQSAGEQVTLAQATAIGDNLLLANGHPYVDLYPLGLLNDEASFIVERDNTRMASEAVLLQAAAASVMGGEEGVRLFADIIDSLREE
jgi:hypothetical protein